MLTYIHFDIPSKLYNGMTVGYMRFDGGVMYAYTLVSKRDTYSRKIGRKIVTERVCDELNSGRIDKGNDATRQMGVVTIDQMREELMRYSVLSKSGVESLDIGGFSHHFISSFLTNNIIDNIKYT